MSQHTYRAEVMPIPPIEDHTTFFDAGPIVIGVEYRVLNDDIAAKNAAAQSKTMDPARRYDDRGVALHIYARSDDGTRTERLRFDCFDEDPHYHYVDWDADANELVRIDPVADGDPLSWALERIRSRLPQMLNRAGAHDLAASVDFASLEAVLPLVSEAAYRARYDHDDEKTLKAALS